MLSPVSLNLLQYYPAANRHWHFGSTTCRPQRRSKDNIDQFLGRVDQNVGNKIRLSCPLQLARHLNSSIGAIPVQGITQPRVNKNTLVPYTHTLKPNLYNDFRIGYHRSTSTR